MEREVKLNPKQTDFYDYLDDIGSKEINGVYNIQSSKFLRPIKPQSDYFWDRLHYSPHQNMLTIKKATRFSIEPMSRANFIAIRYVYNGNIKIRIHKESFPLKTNDVLLLSDNISLSQQLHHEDDIVFTLMFEKEFLINNILNYLTQQSIITKFILDFITDNKYKQNYIVFHGKDNDRIKYVIEDILCEYMDPSPNGEALIKSYITILLLEMLKCSYEFSNLATEKNSYLLTNILGYISENYRNCTLEDLSKEYNYSIKIYK